MSDKNLSVHGADNWAVEPPLQHVLPRNWWAGMRQTALQVLLHGRHIGQADVKLIDAQSVSLTQVVRLPNKNYLLLYLDTQGAPPHTFFIRLSVGEKQLALIPYELKERQPWSGVTFDASDVVYLLMPDRFAQGCSYRQKHTMYAGMKEDGWNRRQPYARHGGDISGMVRHLDYLDELGITTLWPTSMLENDTEEQSYHGYAITNHYRIDPRLGSNDDYRSMVDEAHHRGMKVVMDLVFNHCASAHFLFIDRPADDWFMGDRRHHVLTDYRTASVSDVHASQLDRRLTLEGWFTEQMPCFNGGNRYVADYLAQVSKWWVEYAGINGFRQDTYPYNDFSFMQRWCRDIETEYPGMNIVGETWMNDNVGVSFWQKDSKLSAPLNSGLPTVMDFPLTFLMGRAVDEETDGWFSGLARLQAYLAQDGVYADVNHLMTFLSNHDIDRFQPTEVAAQNQVRYQQALTLLLTLRGIPQLYVGDEIGMYATKGDNDGLLRQDFPGGFPRDRQNAFTSAGRTDLQNAYFNFTCKLLHWRKNNPVVAYGRFIHFAIRNGCYVYARQWKGQTVTVLMNGTSQAQTLDLSIYREVLPARKAYDVLSDQAVRLTKQLTLEPRATLVLCF